MIEFSSSPVLFIKKILSEFIGIPDSCWLIFSENTFSDPEQIFPEELETILRLSADDFFHYDPLKFQFQYFQGAMENIHMEMAKLYLDEKCIGIYLIIENYSSLEMVTNWLKELNKFWVLEAKEALFYQESGLTFGYKIKSDLHLSFFALDENKAMEIHNFLERNSDSIEED